MHAEQRSTHVHKAIAHALAENYESIYSIDLATGAYDVYYESDSYRKLELSHSGSDFFKALENEVKSVVYPKDRPYVLKMLSKKTLVDGVIDEKYYSIVYRIVREGRQVYHQLRATLRNVRDRDYILIGVRDVDSVMKLDAARQEELASERQKADNYLEAILATAIAYTEANLSTDSVIAQSTNQSNRSVSLLTKIPAPNEMPCYSAFHSWTADQLVCENREKYLEIGSREHLVGCYEKGAARASVPFSVRTEGDCVVPCREVFYLYREEASGHIHALCVVYDLTEEQRREKELDELREKLDLSRIRNSASQMKPHFLYNALGSIQEMVLDDPEHAERLLEDFTMHLRNCVKAMDSDEPIPFDQELENIKAYARIERMRLDNRLELRYELQETGFEVLPLCIQPLVENAIRHGIKPLGKKGGVVVLRSFATDTDWVVQVIDTGKGFDVNKLKHRKEAGDSDSAGLRNIAFRLEKLLRASIDIKSATGFGTIATVRIPREAERHEGNNSR